MRRNNTNRRIVKKDSNRSFSESQSPDQSEKSQENIFKKNRKPENQAQGNQIMNIPINISHLSSQLDINNSEQGFLFIVLLISIK